MHVTQGDLHATHFTVNGAYCMATDPLWQLEQLYELEQLAHNSEHL